MAYSTHTAKPRTSFTYQAEPSLLSNPLVIIALSLGFCLVLILAKFAYDFIETYRTELNHAIFYGLFFLGVLLLIVATYSAFYVLAILTLHYQAKRQAIRTTAANNQLFTATAKAIKSGNVYLSEQRTQAGVVKFKSLPKHAKKPLKIESTPAIGIATLPEPEIKTTLLSDIRDYQRILLVGGQNSGKTTLLKHIAKQRSGAGSVLILDSHNTAGKWARDYRIVGHGRDYNAIETELKNLVAVMDSRYKELASGKVGERQHELITVVSDEWTTVSKNLNNLDAYLLPLLTESRKVGIDLILATHSQTAESLGLKGKADLKSAFDSILTLKNISGKRIVELDNGEAVSVYHHCGQFQDDLISHDFTNKLDDILNNPIAELSIEKKIITVYWQLKNENKPISLSAICMAVYGYKKGEKIKLIARILAENSLVTTE